MSRKRAPGEFPLRASLAFLVFLSLWSTINASKNHTVRYEQHASDLLNSAAQRMQHIWNQRREIFFSIAKGRGYNVISRGPAIQENQSKYRHLVHDLATNLSTIPINEIKNPTLRRQVKRLSKLQLLGLKNDDYEKSKEILHQMSNFLTMRLVCQVDHSDDCPAIAMTPGIQKEMLRTRHENELNYYWLQWRQSINDRDKAKTAFLDYVALLRKAAAYNGHVTPSRTWYLFYESENFQREMEDVIWEIMPLYKELHANLRHSVRRFYGERLTDSDGAIPASVLEQIIHQAWHPPSVFARPYPHNHLPSVQERLQDVMRQADTMNRKAADFFESLGMNRLSDTFFEKFARRLDVEEDSPDCESEVYYFPPDVGLRYCALLDYKKLMQMHGHMADIQYSLYRKDLPYGLDSEPCPGFSHALGEAAVIASGTPRHLHHLHVLTYDSLSEEKAMNRLFRMAIHTVLSISQYFINDKFLSDVLDRRISRQELNCAYWKLQYKYAGAVPPEKRTEANFDPDYKFYKGLNPSKTSTIKFISEVLGMQFYRQFCLASGQYIPGDPKYPLHNCDFYGSTKAGDMMKQMMKLGSTRHWRDVMEAGIGERKLSGVGVMEYFAPLYTWLKEENRKLGLDIGWNDDIKCTKE